MPEILLDLTPTDILRFWEKVEEDAQGCWVWVGSRDRAGYGNFRIQHWGRTVGAHRISWYLHQGTPLPPGITVDHLCRNPACVNPEHLEAVPHGENVRRGYAAGSRARTHCVNGHEFTEGNTYVNRGSNGNWRRQCRTCILARSAARYEAQRAARIPS